MVHASNLIRQSWKEEIVHVNIFNSAQILYWYNSIYLILKHPFLKGGYYCIIVFVVASDSSNVNDKNVKFQSNFSFTKLGLVYLGFLLRHNTSEIIWDFKAKKKKCTSPLMNKYILFIFFSQKYQHNIFQFNTALWNCDSTIFLT